MRILLLTSFALGSFMGFKFGFWKPISRSISTFVIDHKTKEFKIGESDPSMHKWFKRIGFCMSMSLLLVISIIAISFIKHIANIDTHIDNEFIKIFNTFEVYIKSIINYTISKIGKISYVIITISVFIIAFAAFYLAFSSLALFIMLILEIVKMEDLLILSILWLMGKLSIVPATIPIKKIWKHYLRNNNPYSIALTLLNRFFPSLSFGGGKFNGGGSGGHW